MMGECQEQAVERSAARVGRAGRGERRRGAVRGRAGRVMEGVRARLMFGGE